MKKIALLEAAILLYLEESGNGTGPEMTEFLGEYGLRTTANYLAMALRQSESRGFIKLIGSHRRFRGGAAANLWVLTRKGRKEAEAIGCLFTKLLDRSSA